MDKNEIIEKSKRILSEEFEARTEDILPEASLKEVLHLDSLDLIDVVVLIDQNFGVSLVASDFVKVKTFGDFYELLDRKING